MSKSDDTVVFAESPTLPNGVEFTIGGLRLRRDGTYTFQCRAGNVTVFKVMSLDDIGDLDFMMWRHLRAQGKA